MLVQQKNFFGQTARRRQSLPIHSRPNFGWTLRQPPATNMHTSLARSLAHPFIQDCPMLSSFFDELEPAALMMMADGGVGVRWRCDDQLKNKPGTFHHTICLCINLHSSQTIASLAYFIVVQLISRLIRTERQNKQSNSKRSYHLWLKHKTRLKRQLWTLGIESQFWILLNPKSSISFHPRKGLMRDRVRYPRPFLLPLRQL